MAGDVGQYLRGAACGLAAVCIWSGWIVVARLGLRTSLTPWDIAALRFGVAGALLLPLVLARGLAFDRLGWTGLAAIVLGGAAPVFLANSGLLFAPAAHAGALFPGVMPLMVALLAAMLLGEEFSRSKQIGFALILPGVLAITLASGAELGSPQNLGHGLFLAAGLAWAFYTVAMRRARLDGLHAAAISAVGSALLYLPVYWALPGTSIAQASWFDIGLQALVQGVLTAIISLMLYGKAVSILGASSGAAFAALSPAMTALMAIPVLGEWPQRHDWAAIVLISAGVYIVSGGPLPRWLQRTEKPTAASTPMTDAPPTAAYEPPKVWTWNKESGGRFAAINRPIAGATHEKELPVGRHPMQLYSLATPNGVKATVMLEELLEAGHKGAEYDAWLIKIDGNQFGSGFVAVNPNSKIPALMDRSGPKPIRVFESGAILVHLAEKFGAFLPSGGEARAECLSWLFWQMGSAPFLGGGFGHFYAYAPIKIEYAIDRYAMEVKRQLDVLDRRLADNEYLAGSEYTIADMATWPWYGALAKGLVYGAGEFLSVHEYKNVQRWTDAIAKRPAVKRGRMVNRISGDPASQLHERHDAGDFLTKTQDKIGEPAKT